MLGESALEAIVTARAVIGAFSARRFDGGKVLDDHERTLYGAAIETLARQLDDARPEKPGESEA